MSIYEVILDDEELDELDALLDELHALSISFAEGDYDTWEEAEATVAEVADLIQRGEEVRELLYTDSPVPESILLELVDDLQLLTAMADVLREMGYAGTYRLKRRAERMIDILDESSFEI